MTELLSIDDALARILDRVRPVEAERVPEGEWMVPPGRVVAKDVRAQIDLPPFPSSAMDGFAVRAADTPGRLPVSFRIAAGRPAPRPLAPREAMGIATGAVVPEGADAVVPLEYVVESDNSIEISTALDIGGNVRPRGGDVRAGGVVVSRGSRLRPAQIGALAAAGVTEVLCARRPLAAVLVTGSELQLPGGPLGPGQIFEANGSILDAQLRTAGAEVGARLLVEDTEEDHGRALRGVLQRNPPTDIVLTSGGVSVGPHDLVRRVAADLGVEEVFWGVAVRPGKPLFFGVRDQTLVFGLPGNPVSTLVGFELFVRPALLALQGAPDPEPAFQIGTLASALRRSALRDQFVRARLTLRDGEARLAPLSGQESHMIARAASADALVHVPRGDGEVPAGATARFLRLE